MIKKLNKRTLGFILLYTFFYCSIAKGSDIKQDFNNSNQDIHKIFSNQGIITDVLADDLIIIPIDLINNENPNTQLKTQLTDSSGIMLIEIKITSSSLFHAYIREKGSKNYDKLDSVDGIHFYGYRELKDKQTEIVLLNTEITFKERTKKKQEDEEQKYIMLYYTIDVMPYEQRVCPFNCFDRGFCQPNGQCLCEEGYSQLLNCQLKTESKPIEFDSQTIIYEYINNEENTNSEDEWKYTKIEILLNEAIQKQIELKQQVQMKPKTVSILFKSQVKQSTSQHKLILLQENKTFTVLKTKGQVDENVFTTTYDMKYSEFQSSSFINFNRGISLVIGHKGLESIEICVKLNYESIYSLFGFFSIIFIITIIILVLSLIIIIVNKSKYIFGGAQEISQIVNYSLDQSEIQLTIEQANQQIQSEMPSFLFQTPSNEQELNGTHYECFICLNKYEDQEECRKTRCGHVFHKDCVDAWLQKNFVCPVDRKSLIIKS